MKDLHNNIQALRAFAPVSGGANNTAVVSQIIDTQGANALEFIISLGNLADDDATFALTAQESNAANMDGSNQVAATDLLGTTAGASFIFSDDNKVAKIGYVGSKRYVTVTITPSANTGAWLHSGVAIKHLLGVAPNTTQLA